MYSEETVIFYGVIAFITADFLWDYYLSYRQYKVYLTHTEIPTELIGILAPKKFEKARIYALDRNKFSRAVGVFSFVINIVFLLCYGLEILWSLGGSTAKYLGYENCEMVQNAVAIVILNFIRTLAFLPFSIYHIFVLEEKHGFNNQTASFFIRDLIKKHIFLQVFSVVAIAGLTYFNVGDFFFLYLWGFVSVLTLFLYIIYPEYIAPIFDNYRPLPEGELRNEIEKLAKSVNFPLYKLYVVESSKRSSHSNAYFFGLFKNKRIVLYDTLLKDYVPEKSDEKAWKEKQERTGCDTKEVLAVLAHELGHWKLNHVIKNLIISEANLLLLFSIFGLLFQYKPLYAAFGFYDSTPMLTGLIIVSVFVCLPYFELISFCLAVLSRHFEFQADAFAKSLGWANHLKLALIKLNSDNLGFPIYDPLYSKLHHSHPPLLERLRALDKVD